LKIDPRSSFAPVASPSSSESGDDSDFDDDGYYADDDDSGDDESSLLRAIPELQVRYAVPLPDRLRANVYSLFSTTTTTEKDEGGGGASLLPDPVGTIWLDGNVFGREPVRVDLLKRAVDYVRAKMRGRRKAKTKTISEVSGSGRKIRQQKGTGTARAGHSRPPHFRGGAKAHGPKNVTDYGNTKLNKKVRKQALVHALSQKLLEGNLIVLDQLHALPTHKTNELARFLRQFGIAGRYGTTALILDHYYPNKKNNDSDNGEGSVPTATSYRGVPVNVRVASSNLSYKVKVDNDLRGLNALDVLKREKLVLTLDALASIESRLANVYY